ncbi:hypothetical protein D3C73_1506120 [compost metagenome]
MSANHCSASANSGVSTVTLVWSSFSQSPPFDHTKGCRFHWTLSPVPHWSSVPSPFVSLVSCLATSMNSSQV